MGGILNENNYRSRNYQFTSTLSFFKTIGIHEVNAIVGMEVSSSKMDGSKATTYGYLKDRGHKFAEVNLATTWNTEK